MDERGEPDGPEVTDALFAENVRIRREGLGFSQAEVMRRLREAGWSSVHQTTVSRIEKGERAPRLGEARLIAQALETSVEMLLRPVENVALEDYLQELTDRANVRYSALVWDAVDYLTIQDCVASTVKAAAAGISDVKGHRTTLSNEGNATLSSAILSARASVVRTVFEALEAAGANRNSPDGQEIDDQELFDRLRDK